MPGSAEMLELCFSAKKGVKFATYLVGWTWSCHRHHMILCANPYDLVWLQRPVKLEVSHPHKGGWLCKKRKDL